MAGSCSIVWNVRSTAISQGALRVTYWLVRLCAICYYCIPDRIICCANSAKTAHIKLRYAADKMTVIPNGYDFSVFELNLNSRGKARRELGFDEGDIAIERAGLVKSFHLIGQQTDVAYFLSAMDICCLLSGNEAFPSVVVDAMAMGLPCVVT